MPFKSGTQLVRSALSPCALRSTEAPTVVYSPSPSTTAKASITCRYGDASSCITPTSRTPRHFRLSSSATSRTSAKRAASQRKRRAPGATVRSARYRTMRRAQRTWWMLTQRFRQSREECARWSAPGTRLWGAYDQTLSNCPRGGGRGMVGGWGKMLKAAIRVVNMHV